MKTEVGTITAIKDNNLVEVKVGRHSDCMSCGACPGAENITITAVNTLHATVGQKVEFEVRDANIVIGAFICFIMPLLAALVGALAGRFAAFSWGYDITQAEIIGGIAAFALGLVGVKLFDRSLSKAEHTKPKIIALV